MCLLAKFGDHRSYRNVDVNMKIQYGDINMDINGDSYINSNMNTVEKGRFLRDSENRF